MSRHRSPGPKVDKFMNNSAVDCSFLALNSTYFVAARLVAMAGSTIASYSVAINVTMTTPTIR
jgi:hypothetical protein